MSIMLYMLICYHICLLFSVYVGVGSYMKFIKLLLLSLDFCTLCSLFKMKPRFI